MLSATRRNPHYPGCGSSFGTEVKVPAGNDRLRNIATLIVQSAAGFVSRAPSDAGTPSEPGGTHFDLTRSVHRQRTSRRRVEAMKPM